MLWCAHQPPRELLKSLTNKGVAPMLCRSAFGAMAEICLLGTIGRGPPGGAILLISEPSEVRGKRAVLTACMRYAPWLRLWVYQSEATVQLRPLDINHLVGNTGDSSDTLHMHAQVLHNPAKALKPRPSGGLRGESSWTLKLTGESANAGSVAGIRSDSRRDEEESMRPSGLLSDEELGMLLADDLDLDDA